MCDNFVILLCDVKSHTTNVNVNRNSMLRSKFFSDYLHCYKHNNDIPYPQQYEAVFDHYTNYCNYIWLKPHDIKCCLELSHYLEDNTYLILLIQDLLTLPNFDIIIDSLITNLKLDVQSHLPTHMFDNIQTKQTINNNVTITRNITRNMGYITYFMTDSHNREPLKWLSQLSSYDELTVHVDRIVSHDANKQHDTIQDLYCCYPWLKTIMKSFSNQVTNNEQFLNYVSKLIVTFSHSSLQDGVKIRFNIVTHNNINNNCSDDIYNNDDSDDSDYIEEEEERGWDNIISDTDKYKNCTMSGTIDKYTGEPQVNLFGINILQQDYDTEYEIYRRHNNGYVHLHHPAEAPHNFPSSLLNGRMVRTCAVVSLVHDNDTSCCDTSCCDTGKCNQHFLYRKMSKDIRDKIMLVDNDIHEVRRYINALLPT